MADGNAALVTRGSDLVARLSKDLMRQSGFSSLTLSIYDTAWLAMIINKSGEGSGWLFPESFAYLLENQGSDGGWDPLQQSTRSLGYPNSLWLTDCIIHSLAALLALCRHARGPDPPADVSSRMLGFELLMPVHLLLLQEEGIGFEFSSKAELFRKFQEASAVDLDWLYDKAPCQVPLFSLEAYIGKLDFSRLSHLPTSTGVAASPASTAAFLIHSPRWSTQCEAYLRHVVIRGPGKGNGSVPGVFPLEVFEPTWVLATLLENRFTKEHLGAVQVDLLLQFLYRNWEDDGVIGATKAFFPDADDTSRILTLLNLNGYNLSPVGLVARFEVEDCFATFDTKMPKRVKSISVNGNVLCSLLQCPTPSAFVPQIEKVARFLCNQWRTHPTDIQDHWNISFYYTLMRMAQPLSLLMSAHNQNRLSLSLDLVQSLAPDCLRGIRAWILANQHADGTWGRLPCSEETAYAVVALAHIKSSHVVPANKVSVDPAIHRAMRVLWQACVSKCPSPDRLWTGKVLHGISSVSEAYMLAALRIGMNHVSLADSSPPYRESL
ncbi:hypothetical protein BP00DRAFT_453997 [Aspergillus indologenus CBS 114.80]|uniref:Terpenoid cyclases/Protein prenyltransferase n=1 Tax=Aspergillus indologenus CBS 114.80 TaxID=1450541 RepID=A0A2V5IJ31_9EURO|nr:hypothetical protein BP00DRAFT_453997 [Aspergillus indologenus CBS 114.80]